MDYFDLCLTWCWKYDADFVRLLDLAFQSFGLSLLQVTPDTMNNLQVAIEAGQITFGAFLDRTEYEASFEPFYKWAREHDSYRMNPKEIADWAEDKAIMHFELINAGLSTPYTIILPSCNEQPSLPVLDLSPLGDRFVIKPSYGGGGQGVFVNATSFEQVMTRRTEYPHLKYLLQKTITPQKIQGRDAWYRVVFCDGQLYPCWWDPSTHIYNVVTAQDESRYGLFALRKITERIAALCKLSFFSTEIALGSENKWVVIDYVNDQIDMRLQSHAVDGVPDIVVEKISVDLARLVKKHCP
jgi:glutathione synthase/RimK-type ligase-like ATP-grasp enzyme